MIFWCPEKVKKTIWRNDKLLPGCNVHIPLQKLHTCLQNQGTMWEQSPASLAWRNSQQARTYACTRNVHSWWYLSESQSQWWPPGTVLSLSKWPRRGRGEEMQLYHCPGSTCIAYAAPMSKVDVFCHFSWNSSLSEEVLLRSHGRHHRFSQTLQMFSHTKALPSAHASQFCHHLVLAVTQVFTETLKFSIAVLGSCAQSAWSFRICLPKLLRMNSLCDTFLKFNLHCSWWPSTWQIFMYVHAWENLIDVDACKGESKQ